MICFVDIVDIAVEISCSNSSINACAITKSGVLDVCLRASLPAIWMSVSLMSSPMLLCLPMSVSLMSVSLMSSAPVCQPDCLPACFPPPTACLLPLLLPTFCLLACLPAFHPPLACPWPPGCLPAIPSFVYVCVFFFGSSKASFCFLAHARRLALSVSHRDVVDGVGDVRDVLCSR